MKRLFLSMMAMAAITTTLTLTSCGSDDDGNDTPDGASILAADGKTLMGNLTGGRRGIHSGWNGDYRKWRRTDYSCRNND